MYIPLSLVICNKVFFFSILLYRLTAQFVLHFCNHYRIIVTKGGDCMYNLDLEYLGTIIGNLSGVPIRLYDGEKLLFLHTRAT